MSNRDELILIFVIYSSLIFIAADGLGNRLQKVPINYLIVEIPYIL